MNEPEVIVEPRNAETGQAPWQVADDKTTGRWYRCELRDGRVVFINEVRSSMPWVGHQPPLSLAWRPVMPEDDPPLAFSRPGSQLT